MTAFVTQSNARVLHLLSAANRGGRIRALAATFALSAALACGGSAETIDDGAAAALREQAAASELDPRVAAADTARILGAADAPIWVIELSDFQCPFCRVWHETTFSDLKSEFIDSGRIRFAYVNMPLSIHQHAREAAAFAMCAGAQGRFYEYASALFETQDHWAAMPSASAHFSSLAEAAGVDAAEQSACVQEGVMAGIVDADYARASGAGVRSTPSFIVGNQLLGGVQPIERLRSAIEAAEAAAATP